MLICVISEQQLNFISSISLVFTVFCIEAVELTLLMVSVIYIRLNLRISNLNYSRNLVRFVIFIKYLLNKQYFIKVDRI